MIELRQDLRYTIRPMEDRDIPQATDIDREAFPTQWPHPTYSSFKHELRNRLAYYIVAYKQNEILSEVVKENTNHKSFWERLVHLKHRFNYNQSWDKPMPPPSREYVIGLAGFWLMVGEAHITTIAVRDAYQRQGIGEQLLISIIDRAIQLNAHIVTLEVRTSNKQAQVLYKKYGFYQAGKRPNYYSDNGEDALIMSTDTITSSSFQSRFNQLKQAHEQRRNFNTK